MPNSSSHHERLIRLGLTLRWVWPVLILSSGLTGVVIIVLMYALSTSVDAVFMQQKNLESIQGSMVLFITALMARGLLHWIPEVIGSHAAASIKRSLREQLFAQVQSLGPSWSDRQSSAELAAAAVEGVEKLDAYYSRYMTSAIHMATVPSVLVIFVIWYDLLSGMILLVTGPLIPLFMSLIGMKAREHTNRQWVSLRRLSSHFLDSVQGLRTLKIFSQVNRKQTEVRQRSNQFRLSTMGVLRVAFLSALVLELFASIATALVAVEIGVRLIEGYIAFQPGLLVLLLAPEFYLPFRSFASRHHAGMEANEAADQIFEILDARIISPPAGRSRTLKPPIEISFHEVTYRYPGSAHNVLASCSFTLHPGTMTCLVGASGSGKTTIARLITHELYPKSGHIRLNGRPLNSFDQNEWLRQVSVVRQNPWLFDDTVWANLLVANPGASPQSVENAARSAEIHERIMQLPQGYHTRIHETGSRFSGGERQRLAIARALIKNSPVIILDEYSSALDPFHEQQIHRTLQELVGQRTILIIAHRQSTVRRADRILVLEQGSIRCSGSHQELLKTSRYYRQLAAEKPEVNL